MLAGMCSMSASTKSSVVISADSNIAPSQTVSSASQNGMLSVDFSTPLAGPARAERIRQMSHNHGAFEKTRLMQEILVKIQQSLRRMPGVSSTESHDIISQLQEVGQVVSQETSQLVDALMNLTLDQEDTDKAVARMGLEASLAKATIEGQAQTIRDLQAGVEAETKRREQAEFNAKKAMAELYDQTQHFKSYRENAERQSDGSGSEPRDDVIKGLEDTIQHLEDQVNNRRSLWVMKHADPQSVARAMETLANSMQDQPAHNTSMALNPLANQGSDERRRFDNDHARGFNGSAPPARPPSVFQRSLTAAPPKFGPLQAGPPRAPSGFDRCHQHSQQQTPWGAAQGRVSHGQGQNPFYGGASQFSRPHARKAYNNSSSRYRPTATDFQPASQPVQDMFVSQRPGTAFGHRPPLAIEQVPQTPTSTNRAGHQRFDNGTPEYMSTTPSSNSTALVSAVPGSLIHMTDRSVATWNEHIMEFYALIRAFVDRHASIPDPAMVMKLSTTHLWPVLLAMYHPLSAREATSYLDLHLRDDNPKCCLVTRVIIDFIVNRVWVPNAWTGSSDNQCTFALMDLEKDLEKTQGQPSAQRQPLLDRQAFIIETIVKNEPTAFHSTKIQDMTGSLVSAIAPLLNRLHNPNDAYRDLAQVTEYAWDLSCKILSSRLTFDFRFPEVGTRFSSQSMLPVWPALDPSELQAKHWRVALVTTPVITCRNDTGSNISAHSVALADVYCMQ